MRTGSSYRLPVVRVMNVHIDHVRVFDADVGKASEVSSAHTESKVYSFPEPEDTEVFYSALAKRGPLTLEGKAQQKCVCKCPCMPLQ